jgi:hypothetical protein
MDESPRISNRRMAKKPAQGLPPLADGAVVAARSAAFVWALALAQRLVE